MPSLFLSEGCVNAFLLDGGGSSQTVVEGKYINNISVAVLSIKPSGEKPKSNTFQVGLDSINSTRLFRLVAKPLPS